MKFRSAPRTRFFFLALAAAASLTACDRVSAPPPARVLKAGAPAVIFDEKRVTELTLVKNDPVTGDSWSARLSRKAGTAAPGEWEVSAAPDGLQLRDRRADSRFVFHLIDTLRTLHPSDTPAPSGPLSSFGLTPPQFSLRWTDGNQSFDIRLGAPAPKSDGRYGYVAAQAGAAAYGTPDAEAGDSAVYVMEGAALQMLNLITGFEVLRHRTLATLTTDDVDEVELWKGSRLAVYAQRDGDTWADRNHRKTAAPIGAWLDGVTHARVRQFIDDATLTDRLLPSLRDQPLFKAVFKDRHGTATRLSVLREGDGRVLGAISSRPDSVFELYPEAIRLFEPPR